MMRPFLHIDETPLIQVPSADFEGFVEYLVIVIQTELLKGIGMDVHLDLFGIGAIPLCWTLIIPQGVNLMYAT